jgi:MFS family permease
MRFRRLLFSEVARPASEELRSNLKHLYWDIFWFGVLAGSTMGFLSIYAARIGATTLQIGLLTAGPAVINLLLTLPAGRWMENRSIKTVVINSAILHRAGYMIMILLPLIIFTQIQLRSILLVTVLMSVPGTFLAISFNSMYADVVPPDWLGHAVGRRNALAAVSVTLTSLMCGWILDQIIFPINYQIVFSIGALGGFLSLYHVHRIRYIPLFDRLTSDNPVDMTLPAKKHRRGTFLKSLGKGFLTRMREKKIFRLELLKGPFGLFILSYLFFYTFQYLSVPLFPAYYVNVLELSDGEISLGAALFHSFMMIGSLRISYLSSRYGHRRVMLIGTLLFCIYPFILSAARDAKLFLVASILGGLVYALLAGGLVNRLMERVPASDRPAHMALHNIALNLGILIGALVGPLLASWVDLRDALVISGVLRLVAAGLMVLWG